MVSPYSFILDALPLSPEIDIKDVWNCEDPPNSVRFLMRIPTKGIKVEDTWSLGFF